MQRYLFNKVAANHSSPIPNINHLEEALSDWFDLGGCYAGFRLSEWAQVSSSSLSSPSIKFGASLPTAFLAGDFRFELALGRRVSSLSLPTMDPTSIIAVHIQWHTQKMGRTGRLSVSFGIPFPPLPVLLLW